LFDVAHDAERPFVVATEDTRIQAIGTAFNVRVRADTVELTVTEGVVAVSNHASESGKTDEQARVMAGKGAVIRSGTIAVTPLDDRMVEQRVAWRDGVISLDGNSIEQAVEEFNRYRPAPIIIGDTRIASLRVGGRFECDESDKFIAALQRSFSIRAIPNADKSVLLLPAG
jgi:transmembrane sensor